MYLSHNQLTEIPTNLPKTLAELRIHANKVKKIPKDAFKGMKSLHVLGKSEQKDKVFSNKSVYCIQLSFKHFLSVEIHLKEIFMIIYLSGSSSLKFY